VNGNNTSIVLSLGIRDTEQNLAGNGARSGFGKTGWTSLPLTMLLLESTPHQYQLRPWEVLRVTRNGLQNVNRDPVRHLSVAW